LLSFLDLETVKQQTGWEGNPIGTDQTGKVDNTRKRHKLKANNNSSNKMGGNSADHVNVTKLKFI